MLSIYCQWRCRSVLICLWLSDGWNPQFGGAVHLVSFTKEVGCILPSRLSQFVELHLRLPKPLHTLLDHYSDCAHHPAGFVIFAQVTLPSLFSILIFPILPIVGPCKITPNVCDSNQHLFKCLCKLSGRQSRDSSMRYIILL
jgi:hypothetical protein